MQRDPRDELFGHPKGVYVCFFTGMWERFSFYGMKALLLLYLLQHHRFGDKSGYDVLGAYGGLVYSLPVIGGLMADRYLGMRKAVIVGGLLLVCGHAGMAMERQAATLVNGVVTQNEGSLRIFYLSLAPIIMGVGFLKPNISTIVGKLYPQNDPRRDSGFSLFYAGINLGALFASIVCGYLGQTLGWSWGFGAAGVGMLFGLGQFLWGQKYLQGHAESPAPEKLRERVFGLPREWAIYLGAVAGLLPVQRQQMIVLIAMCLVFFTLYEQTYGSWVTFTDRMLTEDVVPSLVQAQPQVVWTSNVTTNVMVFLRSAPWSIVSLLLAPAGGLPQCSPSSSRRCCGG